MDIRKIKKLIELLHDTDVAEIEISEGEESVRITRGSSNQVVLHSPQTNWPSTSAPPQPVVSMTAEEAAPATSGSIRTPRKVTYGGYLLPFSVSRYSCLHRSRKRSKTG